MTIRYCLPIIESRQSRVLEVIQAYEGEYDLFEVWLDYIQDLAPHFVVELERILGERGIILFRRRELEAPKLSSEIRTEIISRLEGRLYLDLDLGTQREEIGHVKSMSQAIPLIISYHNYERTPVWEELQGIAREIVSLRASILKIAAFCRVEEEALRLLELLLMLRGEGIRCIVLGMGAQAAVTRVFGPLWGNEFVFAPPSLDKASAPGQITKGELGKIFQALGVQRGGK